MFAFLNEINFCENRKISVFYYFKSFNQFFAIVRLTESNLVYYLLILRRKNVKILSFNLFDTDKTIHNLSVKFLLEELPGNHN